MKLDLSAWLGRYGNFCHSRSPSVHRRRFPSLEMLPRWEGSFGVSFTSHRVPSFVVEEERHSDIDKHSSSASVWEGDAMKEQQEQD